MSTTITVDEQAVLVLRVRGEKRSRAFRCPDVSVDQVIAAAQRDDNTGICVLCGSESGNCEPDTKAGWCQNPDCKGNGVYGAEELVIRLVNA